MTSRQALVTATVAVLSGGCAGDAPPPERADTVLELDPMQGTPMAAGDPYVCLGFEAPDLAGQAVRSVRWSIPAGPAALHHATVFSTADPRVGAAACDAMPADAIVLHVWVPGAPDLDLGPETGLVVPADHGHLFVELHLLSLDAATRAPPRVTIARHLRPPTHLASWLGVGAPVPAIRPRQRETSTATCRLAGPVHLLMTWPHMHRAGLAFHGAAITGGARLPLVDVDAWSVATPRTRSLDLDVPAGSSIETTCVWQNRTDAYILPGRSAADEMCVQGLVGYPFEAMRCDDSGI